MGKRLFWVEVEGDGAYVEDLDLGDGRWIIDSEGRPADDVVVVDRPLQYDDGGWLLVWLRPEVYTGSRFGVETYDGPYFPAVIRQQEDGEAG